MTLLDDIKKEVDSTVWCDSIEWRGKRVTLRTRIDKIPDDDITGSRMVRTWRDQLEEVNPRSVRVIFVVKQYGCVRKKKSDAVSTIVKTWTHCWATFEVAVC
jgi:Tfp pilus assembly protein PilN